MLDNVTDSPVFFLKNIDAKKFLQSPVGAGRFISLNESVIRGEDYLKDFGDV